MMDLIRMMQRNEGEPESSRKREEDFSSGAYAHHIVEWCREHDVSFDAIDVYRNRCMITHPHRGKVFTLPNLDEFYARYTGIRDGITFDMRPYDDYIGDIIFTEATPDNPCYEMFLVQGMVSEPKSSRETIEYRIANRALRLMEGFGLKNLSLRRHFLTDGKEEECRGESWDLIKAMEKIAAGRQLNSQSKPYRIADD